MMLRPPRRSRRADRLGLASARGVTGVVAVAAALGLALTGCAGADASPQAGPPSSPPAGTPVDVHDLAVTGFVQAGAGADRLAEIIGDGASALSMVGVDGVTVTTDGDGVSAPGETTLAALRSAHDAGLPAELLVSNYDDTIGDFSPAIAAALLGDPGSSDAVAGALGDLVREQGWDGIMIDLESMSGSDRAGLTAFADALRTEVGPGIRLDIAVQAASTASEYAELGFDLTALSPIVDRMTLMAYDQHGPWDPTDSGPVGALGWQRQVLSGMLEQVPAMQIDLGIAAYGYVFAGADSRAVSPAEARAVVAEADADARFDTDAGEWVAELPGGDEVWWSDTRSLSLRLDLARDAGIGGAAIWSLDLSDGVRA